MSAKTIYFGYGSNMWLDQMKRRCPESKFIGIGYLPDWRWIINIRGCANVIPSPGDLVYGLLYELTEQDKNNLDGYEGVQYDRQYKPVKLSSDEFSAHGKALTSLIYVDVERVMESQPREEYIYRMNMAIADALKEGVSNDYIRKYLRPFTPESDKQALETK